MARYFKLLNRFLDDTALTQTEKVYLTNSSRELREAIKRFFKEHSNGRKFEPKFQRQGSYVYHTTNKPAHTPPQQMDLDDGCYFPITLIEGKPEQEPDILFNLIERAILPLCQEYGWEYQLKNACVRVEIHPTMHIDIPIYAIPDDEFSYIVEAMDKAMNRAASFAEPQLVDKDKVNMAHRKEGWKVSDPQVVKQWVLDYQNEYKDQITRIWRLMKAWRDYHKSPLSSIYLMACVADIYDNYSDEIENRIDLAFSFVVSKMPLTLSKFMPSPGDEKEKALSQRIDEQDPMARNVAKGQFLAFDRDLKTVNLSDNKQICRDMLARYFGERLSNDLDLVSIPDKPKETPRSVALAAPAIKQEIPKDSTDYRFG